MLEIYSPSSNKFTLELVETFLFILLTLPSIQTNFLVYFVLAVKPRDAKLTLWSLAMVIFWIKLQQLKKIITI